jgi:hypothetical protein
MLWRASSPFTCKPPLLTMTVPNCPHLCYTIRGPKHTSIHTSKHMHLNTHLNTHLKTHTYTSIHISIRTSKHIHLNTHTHLNRHRKTCLNTHLNTHTSKACLPLQCVCVARQSSAPAPHTTKACTMACNQQHQHHIPQKHASLTNVCSSSIISTTLPASLASCTSCVTRFSSSPRSLAPV